MKIQNKTAWLTRDLKRIFCETLRRNERIEGKLSQYQKQNLLVEVVPARNHLNALAHYNGTWVKIRIRKDKVSKLALAQIFDHEVQHLRGYRHESMRDWDLNNVGYEWATDDKKYPLRKKEPVSPKPKDDLQLKRYQHTIRMVKDKEVKLKRLQTLLKKWKKRKRYYERVLVASGKVKGGK